MIITANNAIGHLPDAASQTESFHPPSVSAPEAFQQTVLAAVLAGNKETGSQEGKQSGSRKLRSDKPDDCEARPQKGKNALPSAIDNFIGCTAGAPEFASLESPDMNVESQVALDGPGKHSSQSSLAFRTPGQEPVSADGDDQVAVAIGSQDLAADPDLAWATAKPLDVAEDHSTSDPVELPEGNKTLDSSPSSELDFARSSPIANGSDNPSGPDLAMRQLSQLEQDSALRTPVKLEQISADLRATGAVERPAVRSDFRTTGAVTAVSARRANQGSVSKFTHTGLEEFGNALHSSDSSGSAPAKDVKVHDAADAEQEHHQGDSQGGTDPNRDQTSWRSGSGAPDSGPPPGGLGLTLVSDVNSAVRQVGQVETPHSSTSVTGTSVPMSTEQSHSITSPSGSVEQPLVNTARLIRGVGSSELRIGMQSDEFGKVSITTSHTRDAIVAQIYVDHGDLAKSLAAHLPEVQSRLAANHPVDVRIAMAGSVIELTADSFGNQSNQHSGQEHRGTHSSDRSNQITHSMATTTEPASLQPTANMGALSDNRLDLRV